MLYSIKGEEMILIYDGIDDSLKKLKESGFKLAIVTQKNEKFINNMLGVYNYIGDLFDTVCATDVDTNLHKSDMLRKVCADLGVDISDAVFVGDSYVDALAAQEVGMDFAAALYGWGFRSREDAEQYNSKVFLNDAGEIAPKLLAD